MAYTLVLPFDIPLIRYEKSNGIPNFCTVRKGVYILEDAPNPNDPTLTPWLIIPDLNVGMTGSAWLHMRNEKDMPFYGMLIEKIEK